MKQLGVKLEASILDSLIQIGLQELIGAFHNTATLASLVARVRGEATPVGVEDDAVSATTSGDPRAAASAPEHPSTPLSRAESPPRTSSPSGSLTAAVAARLGSPTVPPAPLASERERFIVALNEQFMVAALKTGPHDRAAAPPDPTAKDAENRVFRVLMRRLHSSQTFGENMIFMLNRAGACAIFGAQAPGTLSR